MAVAAEAAQAVGSGSGGSPPYIYIYALVAGLTYMYTVSRFPPIASGDIYIYIPYQGHTHPPPYIYIPPCVSVNTLMVTDIFHYQIMEYISVPVVGISLARESLLSSRAW